MDKLFSFTPTSADRGSFIGVISDASLKTVNAWVDPGDGSTDVPYVNMDNLTLSGLAAIGAVVRRRNHKAC